MVFDRPHDGTTCPLDGTSRSQRATAAIRFRVGGSLRFLSHAETMRVLERACVRSKVQVRYTEGFNPHPRLSLPLPRPVGVESDEELLIARIWSARAEKSGTGLGWEGALAAELPAGMVLLDTRPFASNAAFYPRSVDYVLTLRGPQEGVSLDRVSRIAAEVMAAPEYTIERTAPGRRRARRIDVRRYLQSIRLHDETLTVRCLTGAGGSVRVDEIFEVLGLGIEDLAGPVRRTNTVWETKQGETTLHPPDAEDEE
jgi:radical SAM-linked protein